MILANEMEMGDWLQEHYVGVQHLYSPHFGGPKKPFNFTAKIADNCPSAYIGCSGFCNSQVGSGPYYTRIPKNTLTLCADCGFMFSTRGAEWLSFDTMSGMATTEILKFEEVEDMLDEWVEMPSRWWD
mmetsp:Transcript_16411/g.22983  ORF Transcript_16411/g.22983 Transcript_16411/m.22983 type:complete len:128 (+) Transcript_16411:3-386(+)